MKVACLLLFVSVVSASKSPLSPRGLLLKKAPSRRILELRGGARPSTKRVAVKKPARLGKVPGGTASMSSEIFNLAKAIVGAGVLSLPAGIAAFANGPSAALPAVGLITMMGLLSAYGFSVIGKVCSFTGATSYRDAWTRTVGPKTSWLPAWSTTLKTSFACLAYSMVLADSFCAFLGTNERTKVLLGLTFVVLLPLCWMKDLASLAPFSLLGVIGMAYTAFAMVKRYLDGSYSGESTLLESVAASLKPSFGDDGWNSVFRPSSLILVCMLSTAYMAHFSAPKFYIELKNNTLPRFNTVVAAGFLISILLNSSIAASGYLTFGSNSAGYVLSNYSPKDVLIGTSRVAVALSLVFSYPIVFQGCRDSLIDMLPVPDAQKRKNSFLNMTTIGLLAVITLFAATLKDVSFVLAFGGATLGNALTYVYPALMYAAVVRKQKRSGESAGVAFASFCAVLGIIMGGLGAKMALEK